LSEVQAATSQISEQSVTRSLVLTGALMKSKNRFAPRFIDAQRSYEMLLLDLYAVQQQSAQAQFRQGSRQASACRLHSASVVKGRPAQNESRT